MNIEALSSTVVTPKASLPADKVDRMNKKKEDTPDDLVSATAQKQSVQPEELLGQIKALTENGIYSVRFENNDSDQLVVKVVDSETNEVIRQIPPEELMQLTKHLNELRGNLVDTVS